MATVACGDTLTDDPVATVMGDAHGLTPTSTVPVAVVVAPAVSVASKVNPTAVPTVIRSSEPAATPTQAATPIAVPAATPTHEPTPTAVPTATPTHEPTPTAVPTATPTYEPTPTPRTSLDRDLLVALYNATDGPNWANNSKWLSEDPVGEWYGVSTDTSERVTRLNLGRNQLSGHIPPELGSLTNLLQLNFVANQLSGTIPPELGNLSNLQRLSLGANKLTGEVPLELGNLSNLMYLVLGRTHYLDNRPVFNQFTGCMSEELYDFLSNIQSNDLHRLYLWTCPSKAVVSPNEVVLTVDGDPQVYNGNVFIMPVGEDIVDKNALKIWDLAKRFYQYFHDAFDFLIFVPNVYPFENLSLSSLPFHKAVSNDVQGIGLNITSADSRFGSAGNLQSAIRLEHFDDIFTEYSGGVDSLLHELIHRWAADIEQARVNHWIFSSANGVLGGFDAGELVNLGGGRYTAGVFSTTGGRPPYSPIELYLAGFIPPEEVPDLLVAEDGKWVFNEDGSPARAEGARIFSASKMTTYTIDDIIATNGRRIPSSSQSQRDFRAATVLLVDKNHPAVRWQVDRVSNAVAAFTYAGPDDGNDRLNFYEATGGRATIAMDGLSKYQKAKPPATLVPLNVGYSGGGSIAFVSERDGNLEIYVMNANGSGITRLTDDPADDFDPQWSPDGDRMAFVSERDGNREVYLMNADGSGITRLTDDPADDFDPQWSPDGRRITFSSERDENREVYLMNADGSGVTRLTDDPADDFKPQWSPDGRRITFSSERDGNLEIYVMDADGSGVTRLTDDPADDLDPQWSPDGRSIAFVSERDGSRVLFVMSADGSSVTRLSNESAEAGSPRWSPVRRVIAFSSKRGTNRIIVANADSSRVSLLTEDHGSYPQWSPDGNRIAFVSERGGSRAIYVMNSDDGAGVTRLTYNSPTDFPVDWGP